MPSAIACESSEIRTKHRHPALKAVVEKIEAHALANGLHKTALKRLIRAITADSLDQASQNALIKCLYPGEPIPPDVVYDIISSLGHGTLKASASTQEGLIRWLIMIYESLEDTAALSRCYGVLFNLLDTTGLRADICHLLSIITRQKHVKPFRILQLNDLARTVGKEPALQKLMLVYEGYAPGSMEVKGFSKRISLDFAQPDAEWASRLIKMQELARVRNQSHTMGQDSNDDNSYARASQRSPVDATRANNSQCKRNLDDPISSLSKPLSADLSLMDLGSRTFQSRAMLMTAEDLAAILDDLLTPLFEHELKKFEGGRQDSKTLSDLLEKVLVFTRKIKTVPEPAMRFFQSFLSKRDGQKHLKTMLDLLSYSPIRPFKGEPHTPPPFLFSLTSTDLQTRILDPLEITLSSTSNASAPTSLVHLLEFYTSLLTHWTARLLSSTTAITSTETTTTIQALTTHTSLLTLTLLATAPPTLAITTSILAHLQAHLTLLSPPLSLPLPPPPALTIYTLLFASPTLPTLDHLSSLLSNYKSAFSTPNPPTTRPPSEIKSLNATLIDICNLLFRSRAFNTADAHALGCLVPSEVVDTLAEYTQSLEPPQPLSGLFALSCHPALVGLSIAAFREMEEEAEEEEVKVRHAGPVTQRSLAALGRDGGLKVDWRQYRVAVLKWLDGMGVKGIKELGEATMKGLMADQEGSKASQLTASSQ